MMPWTDWDHVVKVDPDKSLPSGDSLEDLPKTGTDAIVVGDLLHEAGIDAVAETVDGARDARSDRGR